MSRTLYIMTGTLQTKDGRSRVMEGENEHKVVVGMQRINYDDVLLLLLGRCRWLARD